MAIEGFKVTRAPDGERGCYDEEAREVICVTGTCLRVKGHAVPAGNVTRGACDWFTAVVELHQGGFSVHKWRAFNAHKFNSRARTTMLMPMVAAASV